MSKSARCNALRPTVWTWLERDEETLPLWVIATWERERERRVSVTDGRSLLTDDGWLRRATYECIYDDVSMSATSANHDSKTNARLWPQTWDVTDDRWSLLSTQSTGCFLRGLLQLRFERDSSTIQHPTRSYVLSSNNEHVNFLDCCRML